MIDVSHLYKTVYQPDGSPIEVLHDVSFHVDKGEVVSVIGPSGGGKSMTLKCLNLLERPTSGEIRVAGDLVTAPDYSLVQLRQKMGMVFQSFNLFAHLTVLDNVVLSPMKVKGMDRQEAEALAMHHLRRVGLADKAHAMPATLSGGQQQRTAIARCLAMEPEIVLFDEPTSQLDPTMVGEVQGVIRSLAQEGLTMLIVTHEMKFASDISSRTFFLADGRIVEQGATKAIFGSPQQEATRAFVHRIRKLVFDIESRDFDFYDMTSQIKQFCIRSSIADKMNPITHIVEEMLVLLSHYNSPVRVEVSHSELDQRTSVAVLHKGETLSPFDQPDADELSVMIIRGMSNDIKEEQTPEGIQLTLYI